MISERIKKMIENAERQKVADQFWKEVEKKAKKYNVDVHYFLAEFY